MRSAATHPAAAAAPPLPSRRIAVVPPEHLISQPAVIGAVLTFDILATALAGAATYGRAYGEAWHLGFLAAALACVSCTVAMILQARWSYTIRALADPLKQAADTGIALLFALGALVLATVLLGDDLASLRDWAMLWFAVALAACIGARLVAAKALAVWTRQGRLARRTVIVGGGKPAYELIERLDRTGSGAIQILGLFDDRDKNRSPEMTGRYCKLGRFDDLTDFCRKERIDLLIIALPAVAEERILHILRKLWELPIDVRISAHGSKLKLRSRAYNYIGDVPFLPMFDKPMSDWNVALKALEDRVLAAIGLLVLSPVLAACAVAVKLSSPGPVFFKQTRHGFNNEAIGVYKFRSMYVDQGDATASKLVTRGDPRVTRVGAVLRRTSLDELPQLFNVLLGQLSLVGPRPHAMQAKAGGRIYDQVVEGYFARHRVKPGITGWAQVKGWRGETDTVEKIEQRVAHDLYYIENWSAWLDLKILLMTPLSLVTAKNAY